MLKTPISVLQEVAVQKKLPLPEYSFSGSGQPHCMSFVCHVKIGSDVASGTGNTKKEAKHNAATELLQQFGIEVNNTQQLSNICLLPKKSKRETPLINYVGKLNEFAASHKLPQPDYAEVSVVYNSQFSMECKLLKFQTEGHGTTKKDAKQESAKNMLLLIKDKDIALEPSIPLNVSIELNNNMEEVIKKYTDIIKDMSINSNNSVNNVCIDDKEIPNKVVDIKNWEDLTNYMHKQGWRHDVSVFQSHPLMLCLKINDHTFINNGNTREEIYEKFVDNVVQMLIKGIDLSAPLIESKV